jgi:hypothetical protein
MAVFGSPTGPLYPLGQIVVTTAGTPVPLSVNVSVNDAFGTVANPSPLKCCKVIVSADPGNTANKSVYLCFAGQAAAQGNGTSVILQVPTGTTRILESQNLQAIFTVNSFTLDADVNGSKAFVTLQMV